VQKLTHVPLAIAILRVILSIVGTKYTLLKIKIWWWW